MSPSPKEEGRSPKRRKSDIALANGDTAATDGNMAENIVDVIVDGDVLLGLSSLAGMNKAQVTLLTVLLRAKLTGRTVSPFASPATSSP